MDPDLSASITMHPHPFRLEHAAPSRSASRTPSSPAAGPSDGRPDSVRNGHGHVSNNEEDAGQHKNASSTGVEIKADEDDAAVERHPSTHPASPDRPSPCITIADVEGQMTSGVGVAGHLPRLSAEDDPYGLASAYKTEQELERIRSTGVRKRVGGGSGSGSGAGAGAGATANNMGGTGNNNSNNNVGHSVSEGGGESGHNLLSQCLPLWLRSLLSGSLLPAPARRALQTRKLRGFYKSQNALIENMLKSVEEHQAQARQEQGDDQLRYRIAVWGSFAANVVLATLQMYGAVSSGSLSLFTTMADAIFDPLSNVTLILSNRAVRHVDPARFPSGKARLETVGNIVFCYLMTAVSFILIAFSIRDLAVGHKEAESDVKTFHLASVLAVAIAFGTKLALFLFTWTIKDRYSQVDILWQDHRNDLLVNGFGLLTSVGGSKLVWWIDPAGAVVLGVVISVIWQRTAISEFLLLVGVVAPVQMQRLITYVCVTHSPAVQQIDTVRVYHSGPRLIAEVDIVMAQDATLGETHDVAEALQSKLEQLPDIERAYVHVDYETTHKPEHAYKKDL